MCCILSCFNRPSYSLIQDIATTNRDGMGIMWTDPKTGLTRWEKGLDEDAIHELSQHLPLPFLIHARLTTVGDSSPQLTHPFPIEQKPSLKLSGSAEAVLMHNGHVGEWRMVAEECGLQLPRKNPFGWSDTRVVASAIHNFGKDVVEAFSPSRFAILSGGEVELFGDWLDTKEEGIKSSSETCWVSRYGGSYAWGDDYVSGIVYGDNDKSTNKGAKSHHDLEGDDDDWSEDDIDAEARAMDMARESEEPGDYDYDYTRPVVMGPHADRANDRIHEMSDEDFAELMARDSVED